VKRFRRTRNETRSELPGGFRRSVERWEKLRPALEAGADPAEEIELRIQELDRILAPYDAIHLLGQFAGSEYLMRRSDEYVESEDLGSAYVVEIIAAMLARRRSRAGEQRITPFIDARTLGPSRELVHEITALEAFRRRERAMSAQGGAFGAAQGRAAFQHLMLRWPGWPHQETEVLTELFGRTDLVGRLRQVVGFDARDAVACVEAFPQLVPRRVEELMNAAHAERRAEALAWAGEVMSVRKGAPQAMRDRAFASLWALTHLGDALLFTAEELASVASVTVDVAAAVIAALATPFGQVEDDIFKAAERIRAKPYLDLGDGSYFPTLPGNDLWALRGLLETALAGNSYAKRRGQWLERKAAERIAAALAPDEIYFEVDLFPIGGGEQVGELDALLRYGDTVIVIEAKSATQRTSARRGGEALIDHLHATVTKAAEQAALAQRALRGEEPIEMRTNAGAPLTLGAKVREVHPIVVTLDDLSGVAPVLWELTGTSVMPSNVTIPWVVTWYELDLVCDLVQWPAQLVHFLRRRSRMNEIGRLHAAEELDWWMLYFNQGLYFEEDENLRGDQQVRYLSQTDELDAWVLWKTGSRTTAAPKPKQDLDAETERLLDFLSDVRPPGWIPAGCAVLDMSGATRERMHTEVAEARKRAAARGLVQRGAFGFGDAIRPFLLAWLVAPDEGRPVIQEQLRDLVDQRLEEQGLQPVVAFGLTASSPRPFDALLVLEAARWGDAIGTG
jgi:hypothetical protein